MNFVEMMQTKDSLTPIILFIKPSSDFKNLRLAGVLKNKFSTLSFIIY